MSVWHPPPTTSRKSREPYLPDQRFTPYVRQKYASPALNRNQRPSSKQSGGYAIPRATANQMPPVGTRANYNSTYSPTMRYPPKPNERYSDSYYGDQMYDSWQDDFNSRHPYNISNYQTGHDPFTSMNRGNMGTSQVQPTPWGRGVNSYSTQVTPVSKYQATERGSYSSMPSSATMSSVVEAPKKQILVPDIDSTLLSFPSVKLLIDSVPSILRTSKVLTFVEVIGVATVTESPNELCQLFTLSDDSDVENAGATMQCEMWGDHLPVIQNSTRYKVVGNLAHRKDDEVYLKVVNCCPATEEDIQILSVIYQMRTGKKTGSNFIHVKEGVHAIEQ